MLLRDYEHIDMRNLYSPGNLQVRFVAVGSNRLIVQLLNFMCMLRLYIYLNEMVAKAKAWRFCCRTYISRPPDSIPAGSSTLHELDWTRQTDELEHMAHMPHTYLGMTVELSPLTICAHRLSHRASRCHGKASCSVEVDSSMPATYKSGLGWINKVV